MLLFLQIFQYSLCLPVLHWIGSLINTYISTLHINYSEKLVKNALQCALHKLRPINVIVASFTEIAPSWNLSCVWLAFVLMLMSFHHSKAKNFCLPSFLARKKMRLATSQAFFFSARKLAKQNVFAFGWWKIVSISIKASHIHRKNLRMLQLLWSMQLQIQCVPVELRPNVYSTYVTKEPAEFHA